MKRILCIFILFFTFLGCDNAPQTKPLNNGFVTESDNGKSLMVNKGMVLTIKLDSVKDNTDFYWSVDKVEGGLVIVSEDVGNGTVTYKVQANDKGSISIDYVQFTDTEAKILKKFVLKISGVK